MKSFRKFLQGIPPHLQEGLILFVVGFLAYGLYLSWMGFYWDDWGWISFASAYGNKIMLRIDQAYRPVSGVILYLGSLLFGENPLGWQVYNFIARFFTALSFWWFLNQLWPKQKEKSLWLALVFLVYPGFNHQFVAVNGVRHVLPFAFFFLSLGTMLKALRDIKNQWLYTLLSIAFGLTAHLATEYYYGLELLRPFIIYLAHLPEKSKIALKKTVKSFLPYLGVIVVLFLWRYQVSQSVNYKISFLDEVLSDPSRAAMLTIKTLLENFKAVLLEAPAFIFDFSKSFQYGSRAFVYSLIIAVAGAIFCYLALIFQRQDRQEKPWARQSIALGIIAIAAGGLSFYVTQVVISVTFPANRGLLPLSLGASLVLVGLIEWLLKSRTLKVLALSLFVGLSLNFHFRNAQTFKSEVNIQSSFFNQLTIRVPSLEENTILYAMEFPLLYTFDNSLSSPLNLLYSTPPYDYQYPYILLYLNTRNLDMINNSSTPVTYQQVWHFVSFNAQSDHAIAVEFKPPSCLHILDPRIDLTKYKFRSSLYKPILPLTHPELIGQDPNFRAEFLETYFSSYVAESWCSYYQKADLARQQGDWEQVLLIGEEAFSLALYPADPYEYIPFIQASAYTGDFETASLYTSTALQEQPELLLTLCKVWETVTTEMVLPNEALQLLDNTIDC